MATITAAPDADAKFRAGSWIGGYQAVSPAPVGFIQGSRSRHIGGHHVKGAWSDPWWVYDPDHGWGVSARWRSKAQRVFNWPEKTYTDVPAIEEREVTPWPPAAPEGQPEPEPQRPVTEEGEETMTAVIDEPATEETTEDRVASYWHRQGVPAPSEMRQAQALGVAPSEVAVPAAQEVTTPPAGTVAVREQALDGNRLLCDAYTALKHFAVWPSEAALVTAVLWAAQAHARRDDGLPVWQYSPRLFFTSAEGGSGKSWMARLVAKLSPDGRMLVEATKASLVRLIARRGTVVITEMDVLVGNGGRTRWFTGLANAGYEQDQATSRVDHGKELEIPLMGPMVLDGLDTVIHSTGRELRTLMSRCIIIHAKRAPDGYRAPRFDDQARAVFRLGSEKIGAWMAHEVRAGIADDIPEVPEGLGNRPASLWEPLFAVAGRAGGNWPGRARQACEELESAAGVAPDDEQEQAYRSALDSWAGIGADGGEEA